MRWTTFVALQIGIFLTASSQADAQLSKRDKQRIAVVLTAEINRAINERTEFGLREKVVRRMSECGLVFAILSAQAKDGEPRARFRAMADISVDVGSRISGTMSVDRFKQIANLAKSAVDEMMKRRDEKETLLFLRNCKSFHEPNEIKDAVAELAY